MSGVGCLATIAVVAIVTCIVYLVRRFGNAKSTKLKTQPPMRTVPQKPRSKKKQSSVLDRPYTEQQTTRILRQGRHMTRTLTVEEEQATRILEQGYRERRSVTMEYDTANPKPGRPPINIRDIDVFGLGNGYVDTFCYLRNERRTFKISRVRWARLGIGIYQIPVGYEPSTWVKYGWGEVSDEGSKDAEAMTEEVSGSSPSSAQPHKWVWGDTPAPTDQAAGTVLPDEPRSARKRGSPSEPGEGRPRSYVRFDWEKRFEDSIISPFPEELTPASRYLHEAYQLEKEGADQASIEQALQKAREADTKATSFYISRQSIIRKRKGRQT